MVSLSREVRGQTRDFQNFPCSLCLAEEETRVFRDLSTVAVTCPEPAVRSFPTNLVLSGRQGAPDFAQVLDGLSSALRHLWASLSGTSEVEVPQAPRASGDHEPLMSLRILKHFMTQWDRIAFGRGRPCWMHRKRPSKLFFPRLQVGLHCWVTCELGHCAAGTDRTGQIVCKGVGRPLFWRVSHAYPTSGGGLGRDATGQNHDQSVLVTSLIAMNRAGELRMDPSAEDLSQIAQWIVFEALLSCSFTPLAGCSERRGLPFCTSALRGLSQD